MFDLIKVLLDFFFLIEKFVLYIRINWKIMIIYMLEMKIKFYYIIISIILIMDMDLKC